MLDERKVKLMTRMALYEEQQGREDLKVSAYYRKDYTCLLYTSRSWRWSREPEFSCWHRWYEDGKVHM